MTVHGAGVNLLQVGGGNVVRTAGEGGLGGMTQIDGDIRLGSGRSGIIVVESDTVEGGGSVEFGSKVNLLGERIVIVVVQRQQVRGEGAVGERIPARQTRRDDRDVDAGRVALVAFRIHIHIVCRVRGEAGNHIGGAGHQLGGPVVQASLRVTYRVAGGTEFCRFPGNQGGCAGHLRGADVDRGGAERVRGERLLETPSAVFAATAIGTYIDIVLGVVRQVGEREGMACGVFGGAGVHVHASRDGHNFPSRLITVDVPVHITSVGRVVAERDTRGLAASGDYIHNQIVHIAVCTGGGVFILEGDVDAGAIIVAEHHGLLLPRRGRRVRIDGVHRHEGGGTVDVFHHAHNQAVATIGGLVHKAGLQRVDRDGRIYAGHDGNVVGAGGSCIEIERP